MYGAYNVLWGWDVILVTGATGTVGAAVVAEFIEQQEQWLSLMAEITSVVQLNARVPISISPLVRLKLGDVFGFVIAHNARHIQQADRVLAGTLQAV